jgi:hypothetical protein
MKIEIDLPDDIARFRFQESLNARLQTLLDRQDSGLPLTSQEKDEAEGLVDLVEMVSLLNVRTLRSSTE